jgi:hypothetical protein
MASGGVRSDHLEAIGGTAELCKWLNRLKAVTTNRRSRKLAVFALATGAWVVSFPFAIVTAFR